MGLGGSSGGFKDLAECAGCKIHTSVCARVFLEDVWCTHQFPQLRVISILMSCCHSATSVPYSCLSDSGLRGFVPLTAADPEWKAFVCVQPLT